MKHNDTISTPRIEELKRKKKKAFKVKIAIFSGIVLVILFGLACLLRLRNIRIQSVTIEGTKVLEQSSLEQSVRNDISGYYLWVFPKNNILLYPKQKIINDLRTTFPRIKDLSINLKNSHDVVVTLTERTGDSLWCGNTFPEPTGSPCYFIDNSGFIFTEAPYFSGAIYFRWYGGSITNDSPISTSIFTGSQMTNLQGFISSLRNLDLDPYALVIRGENNYEIYLKTTSGSTTKIIFKPSDSLEKISQNLSAALITEPLKTVRDGGFKNISYIDLRFENKVYFK